MAESVQFTVTEVPTNQVLAVEFGPKLKCHIIVNSKPVSEKPAIDIVNTVFNVSEQKKRIIEQESKGEITIDVGNYTKLEVENAKILFHANEIPVEFDNATHVEKAYQNLMDNIIAKFPEYTSESSETKLENFIILLSIPFVQNEDQYSSLIQIHLTTLKNFGFTHITFLNQIASSFYSQKDKIQQDNLKESPKGILVNIGKTTQIGLMNTKILSEGFLDLKLGTTNVLNHSLAILRDLNILGIGQETVIQWLINEGRVDGKAPPTSKTVRRKEVSITPILNTPRILFDYEAVTGMKNDPNSITEGIKQSIELARIDQLTLDKMLKTIIITGPGAFFVGLEDKFKSELSKIYPDKELNIIIGEDPLNCVLNGLLKYLSLWPKLKVFNLAEQTKDVVVESPVQQNILQQSLDELKSLKLYISNLNELVIKATNFATKLETLPKPIKSFVTINMTQESKTWAIEFNLFLNPLIKRAQTSLEECDKVADEFRTIGVLIAKLPIFIKPIMSKVFTSYVQGLKMVRSVHSESVSQEYLNILIEISKQFANKSEYTLDDLVNASKLNKSTVVEILEDYLDYFKNIGYINSKFVFLTDEKLKSLSTKLESIKERYFSSFNPSTTDATTKLVVIQIIKYYDFLIKGYQYLQYSDLEERCVKERHEFKSILSARPSLLV